MASFSVPRRSLIVIILCFLLIVVGFPSAHAQSFMDKAKKALVETVTTKVGEAVGADAPLHLDHNSALRSVEAPSGFSPKLLQPNSNLSLDRPLAPGDYSLPVIGYCTALGVPSPGNGLGQKIAPLQGKNAKAVANLVNRGTVAGVPVHTLQTMVWRIEDGLPVDKWPTEDQQIVDRLIPEHKNQLNGDYVENIQKNYSKSAKFLGLPSFDTLLSNMGEPGKAMLRLREARQTLANKAISNERQPQLLFEQAGRPVLPSSPSESSSEWSEIHPGVIARFITVGGADNENRLEFRVLPSAVKSAESISNSFTHHPYIEAKPNFQLVSLGVQGQDSTIKYYPSIASILTGSALMAGQIINIAGETFVIAAETATAIELAPVVVIGGAVYMAYSIGNHATQPLIILPSVANGGTDPDAPYANDTPDKNKDAYRPIKGTPAKVNTGDGSVWEPDTAGHGGSEWKRWPKEKDWENGRTPTSVRGNGTVVK